MTVHVTLKDVHVSYPLRIGGRERSTMAGLAATASFGRIAGDLKKIPEVHSLRGVSLHLEAGDRVAIIGRNGAGKSTLLKTISRILYPKHGDMHVEGDVISLLSLGAGTNMEASARENLKMIGRLLRIENAETDRYTQDVFEFTELGEFFDMPLNTYSSGMLVRFMFGAMTYKSSDILVVDEIIGAGDNAFFQKAQERAKKLFEESKILILSSHAPEITFELCNRAIWLDQGKIVYEGSPQDVWDKYLKGDSLPPPQEVAE